jgi:hypothetical protein
VIDSLKANVRLVVTSARGARISTTKRIDYIAGIAPSFMTDLSDMAPKQFRDALSFNIGLIDHAVRIASEFELLSLEMTSPEKKQNFCAALDAMEGCFKRVPDAFSKINDPSANDVYALLKKVRKRLMLKRATQGRFEEMRYALYDFGIKIGDVDQTASAWLKSPQCSFPQLIVIFRNLRKSMGAVALHAIQGMAFGNKVKLEEAKSLLVYKTEEEKQSVLRASSFYEKADDVQRALWRRTKLTRDSFSQVCRAICSRMADSDPSNMSVAELGKRCWDLHEMEGNIRRKPLWKQYCKHLMNGNLAGTRRILRERIFFEVKSMTVLERMGNVIEEMIKLG